LLYWLENSLSFNPTLLFFNTKTQQPEF